jgi:hypothetical protein
MQPEVVTEQPLKLGKEYPGPNEIKVVDTILKMLKSQMLRMYPPGKARCMQKSTDVQKQSL